MIGPLPADSDLPRVEPTPPAGDDSGLPEPDGEYDGVDYWLTVIDIFADATGARPAIQLHAPPDLPSQMLSPSRVRHLARCLLAAAARADSPSGVIA